MGILIGPTPWWQSLVVSTAPVGSTLPDGSRLICKAGGTAWIVAPASTQVSQCWNTLGSGIKTCVCDWPVLDTRLIDCGFTPGGWFVPTAAQLQNPGYVCRTQWDTFTAGYYWSANGESGAGVSINFTNGSCCDFANCFKACVTPVRAFRCVTY
jgi:hypothetical protein